MKDSTKRTIKNAAKTGGKWTLQGVKLAGKGALSVAELGIKGIANVASSPKARRILAGAGTLAASVAFAPAVISVTAMNYMFQNCILDKNYSPVDAIKGTFRGTNSVLKGVLDLAAPVIAPIANETSKLAKKGKEALDR